MPRIPVLLSILGLLLTSIDAAAQPKVVASGGDAYVSQGTDTARSWFIGSSGIRAAVTLDPRVGLEVRSLVNPTTGKDWVRAPKADTAIVLGGSSHPLGGAGGAFAFVSATTASSDTSVTLTLTFAASGTGLRLTRTYVCYSAAPVVETWTSVQLASGSRARAIDDLNAWRLAVTGNQVQWVTGLYPSLMASTAEPFTTQVHTVGVGETFALGSQGRSSESALPYFVLQSGSDALVGGLEWSGAWSLAMTGVEGGVDIALGLGPMSTTVQPGTSMEMPHGFFGVTSGSPARPGLAVRAFIDRGLRDGRAFPSLVTANTWFQHGTAIDQASMTAEIAAAAPLGAELFVVDAGYYPGAGARGSSDFTSGLGTWTADPGRFPDGLAALAKAAHDRGMKFGIWVEPERVALTTVGQPGLAQGSFLATRDGRYDPNVAAGEADSAQICLASPAARAWVLERLTQLIDAVQPDYLKWDNNSWINCNAVNHGHGATDGNFQHVQGLYAILAALRARYPGLIIENCSAGGNRLDFGMLRYTDVGWMDDRTSPATTVRHNLEGLLSVLPPAYLFSFVIDADVNPADGSLDLSLMFRSRMPGVLGLGFSPASAAEALKSAARREIDTYKALRDIQLDAHGIPLSAPSSLVDPPSWDSVEEVAPATGEAVVFAFQADPGVRRTTVQLVGLVPGWTYEVSSADAGTIATATGADLMAEGLEVNASPASSAHLLVLRVTDRAEATR